jgi:error-prone DNA polymerase
MEATRSRYNPIHCRSYFSLLRGVLSPEQLCEAVSALGFSAIGITDITNFYGVIRFLKAAQEFGLKPVCGVAFADPPFTLYCRDLTGFARANELLSRYLSAHGYALYTPENCLNPYCNGGTPFDPVADLVENGWEGLWICSDDTRVLGRFMQRSCDDLFAALYYGKPFARTVSWAREADIPLIALNDAVYTCEQQRRLFRLLRAIDLNTTLDTLCPEEQLASGQRLARGAEMERCFSAVPEALAATATIVEESELGGIIRYPYVFPAFHGYSEAEAFRHLRSLCYQQVEKRYGSLSPAVEARIRYELSVIRNKGFANYFLVVHDIVRRYPRTCGRGSAAASIVSYLLGITHVDPLQHNLFFERFLNMGRKDPPDIDVDFPWDEREQVLDYVFTTYARRAGMVADHVTFGPRSSLREPAKAMGVEEQEIGRMVTLMQAGKQEAVPGYLVHASRLLRGMPRHLGTHPGGVVITPGEITAYTHLQVSPEGLPLIAWEKDATEDAGLVKIDLLGNRSLGVLRDTLELVNEHHLAERAGVPLEWSSFDPLHDRGARELIEAGDTLGVFYVESPATRQLLKKMKTGSFEHLVIASSIIRPAANRYINEFVRRLHGGSYPTIHPLVEDTLQETKGIMVYQEDVARVAIAIAGFSAAEADGLRKVLSRKDREVRLRAYKKRFFEGGEARDVSQAALEALWDMILSFDGYSFCKAHSASYALVSYRLAWLKRYFPLEFLVSVINNGGGFYNGQVYLNEVRRLGVPVLQPDVNHSQWHHAVEQGGVRIGLAQIREVSDHFLMRVIAEREKRGTFSDFFDFVHRLSPGFACVRMLIRCGSLDSIAGGYTRPQLFWAFYHMDSQPALFAAPPVPDCVGDYSSRRKLYDELATLGIFYSLHPLTPFQPRIEKIVSANGLPQRIDSRDIPRLCGKRVCIAGVMITGKEVRTKHKHSMGFVSFEDEHAVFETVIFPQHYDRLRLALQTSAVFLVVGTIQEEFGAYSIELEDLISLGGNRVVKTLSNNCR